MFGKSFGHDSIRKYVVLFGTLFNDVWINRSAQGEKIDSIKVPLTYAAKDKMLARVLGDPELDKKVAIQLPRMSFELENISYDASRKFSKVTTVGRTSDSAAHTYSPTPYNLDFNLYIFVKNSEDGTKIVEQILPYFTPYFSIAARMVPGMESTVDVPVVLNSVTKEDTYDGDYRQRRAIIWTLNFTVRGFVFGPVIDRQRIQTAITNIFTNWETGATPDVTTVITPENMDDF
jgi:hypothetical protein